MAKNKLNSLEALNIMCRDQEYRKFLSLSNIKKRQYLKQSYEINEGTIYQGKYREKIKRVELGSLKNPFTGQKMMAIPINSVEKIKDQQRIKIELLLKRDIIPEDKPEDIFCCKVITQSNPISNEMDYGGLPIYSKRQIEDELQSYREQSEAKVEALEKLDIERRMKHRVDLKEALEEKEISNLIHFTRTRNLKSILMHGLCSVNYLFYNNIKYSCNDENRFDYFKDCINLSVEYPNIRTLSRFKEMYPNDSWVILKVDPKVILDRRSYFALHNAASYEVRRNLMSSTQVSDFKRLFDEHIAITLSTGEVRQFDRRRLSKYKFLPTSDQAEILIAEKINTNYINEIVFSNENDMQKFSSILLKHGIRAVVDANMFSIRRTSYFDLREAKK